jgi:hypothetical protein
LASTLVLLPQSSRRRAPGLWRRAAGAILLATLAWPAAAAGQGDDATRGFLERLGRSYYNPFQAATGITELRCVVTASFVRRRADGSVASRAEGLRFRYSASGDGVKVLAEDPALVAGTLEAQNGDPAGEVRDLIFRWQGMLVRFDPSRSYRVKRTRSGFLVLSVPDPGPSPGAATPFVQALAFDASGALVQDLDDACGPGPHELQWRWTPLGFEPESVKGDWAGLRVEYLSAAGMDLPGSIHFRATGPSGTVIVDLGMDQYTFTTGGALPAVPDRAAEADAWIAQAGLLDAGGAADEDPRFDALQGFCLLSGIGGPADPDRALACFKALAKAGRAKGIVGDPAPEAAAMESARKAYAAGDYAEAQRRFDEGLRFEPADPLAWKGRANALYAQRRFKPALVDFKVAAALAPEDASLAAFIRTLDAYVARHPGD